MMEYLMTSRIIYGWFAIFCVVVPFPSFSLQQTKHKIRTTRKHHDRFADWARSNQRGLQNNNDKINPLLLWIDGNNVRGIGKFEWNAVELQHRVVRFCHKYRVPNAIVVWDHGSHQLSCSKQYHFNDSGKEIASSEADVPYSKDDKSFCVNLITLFSGIRQRADDVLVKESNHLVSLSFRTNVESDDNTKLNWSSNAFVTNDTELNYKLRRQAVPNSPSIRLSRRRRRDAGKIYNSDSSSNNEVKDTTNPLFCDSTGFVDLLCEISREYDMAMNAVDQEASTMIEKAKDSLRECSKGQRRGYNPRREKTWERCVQAETLRRFIVDQEERVTKEKVNETSPADTNDAVFVANYLNELQTKRGYISPLHEENREDRNETFLPFLAPSRLDKRQRRLLDRYNALVKNGEITS